MASLPPLSHDSVGTDNFSASIATFRARALGGRKIKTRQTTFDGNVKRFAAYEQEMMSGKFGPKTPMYAPMSLLGTALSEKDLHVLKDRFSLSQHRQRASAPLTTNVVETRMTSAPFSEETKDTPANPSTDLADFASRLKNTTPALLFCSKILGDGHRPETREGGTLTAINRKLYLFGGRCRKLFNDVKVLDPTVLRWEEPKLSSELGGLPEPRVNHSAVCFQNQLVIYGGCEKFNDILQIRNCFHLVHFFDTGEW